MLLRTIFITKEGFSMWILFAFGSAFFAGVTAIFAKIGLKDTNSTVDTAIRTIVILMFSWFIAGITGTFSQIHSISAKTLLFLVLSGLATGASWLFYFRALKTGDVNKVTPIDKSSVVLTMVLAMIFLGEPFTWLKLFALICIAAGTYMMIERKENKGNSTPVDKPVHTGHLFQSPLFYALLSAIFASLTSILGKVGIQNIDSNLGTAIRTTVVLVMAWLMVFVPGKQNELKKMNRHSLLFLILSGVTTGLSWLCYYRALQIGDASVVVPIDKLSVVITILFSYFLLKEKISKKAVAGLVILTSGTLLLLL